MEEASQHGNALAQPLLTQPPWDKASAGTGDFTSSEKTCNDPEASRATAVSAERSSFFQVEGYDVDDGQDDDSVDGFKLFTQSNDLFKDNASDDDDAESSSDGSRDDNSQTSSSGGEDDGDDASTDEKKDETPLQERRERNIRKRESWVKTMKLELYAMNATAVGDQCSERKREVMTKHDDGNAPGRDVDVKEESAQRKMRGMIFSISSTNYHRPPVESTAVEPPLTTRSLVDDLEPNYPHRSKQIRILCSQLVTIVQKTKFAWQMNENVRSFGNSQYSEASYQGDTKLAAPAPIMITGAGGVGKTCIVRDAMKALQRRTSGGRETGTIAHAYVDCASLECGTVAAAMNSAYKQLYECCQLSSDSGRGGKVRTKGSVKSGGDRARNNLGTARSTLEGDGFGAEFESEAEDVDAVTEDQIERQRKRKRGESNGSRTNKKASDTATGAKQSSNLQKNVHQTRTRLQKELASKAASEPAFGKPASLKGSIQGSVNRNMQNSGSVALFGRATSALIQGGAKKKSSKNNWRCAFLILDSADRILSWKKHGSVTPLTQIFLLPSVMGINLTLIFISRSTLLQYSPVLKAPAALLNAVHPQRIHFDSYTSVETIKTILHAPRVKLSIVGHSTKTSHTFSCMVAKRLRSQLNELLYSSMMNSFVPSVKSTTQDLTEIIRLARLLWVEYVAPFERANEFDDPSLEALAWQVLRCLSRDADFMSDHCRDPSSSLYQCLSSETDDDAMDLNVLKQRLSEKLDRNIREDMRRLLSSTAMMPGRVLPKQNIEHYAKRLPYTTKFLLLAAFLCQSKRPEQDVNLFTKKNTGKSKRSHAKKSGDGLAYASSKEVKQRQPSFPLERLFSVFHSIIGQYGQHFMNYKEGAPIVSQLGSERLFQNVSQLIASGLLSSIGSAKLNERCDHDPMEIISAKFSCKISKDDATSIASSVGFPLEKYCP